jgi:AAA+ ATPase superfamily predicted ATPase
MTFSQSSDNLKRLGLWDIPFTESPTPDSTTLPHLFTGRERELQKVFNLFQGHERRRILVYGRIGIGKSAFLLRVLSELRYNLPQMMFVSTSLSTDQDLATAAFIALAQKMPNDEWAQGQLYQMGIPTYQEPRKRSNKVGAAMGVTAEATEEDLPITKLQNLTIGLERLVERAQKEHPQGVLIAIDDLDKQNPSRVRQLMHDAQGILKGRAWFLLTGHPIGMTGDLLTSERGLFDLQLKLEELDSPTTYQMLSKYLSSARINNDCTDVENPRSVLPFLPETAAHFCQRSMGKPRLFNRLGSLVLSTAAELKAKVIYPEILQEALKVANTTLRDQAQLNVKEERIRLLLEKRGSLSDDTISMADLEQLGFRSYSEILPFLERLEDADLAYQLNQDDAKAFAPIPLPAADDESPSENI